jgi:hypothetical protein
MATNAAIPVSGVTATFTVSVAGLVPAPGTVQGYFLRDDGTWDAAGGGGTVPGSIQPMIAALFGGL